MAEFIEVPFPGTYGPNVARFDGDVFEVFGQTGINVMGTPLPLASFRLLARQMSVTIQGPDKKGRYTVQLLLHDNSVHTQFFDEGELQGFTPMLNALQSSGVAIIRK